MRYRVRSVGKDLEGNDVGEILCGENTSLEFVGRASRNNKTTLFKAFKRRVWKGELLY